MADMGHKLPCPPMTLEVALPIDPQAPLNLHPLPARPGVFALENDTGATITLAVTANLRRLVKTRLTPQTETRKQTRNIDYRSLTRSVRAVTVGSSFEADWAYLQLARQRLPHTYRSLLDRWRGWFIHCNPQTQFPRFTKTDNPAPAGDAAPQDARYFGPFPDKHAAQRCIDTLHTAFDLCRHYHILVDAPNASACAYKEMGRCPAPCDGSIPMEQYRRMIAQAIDFLTHSSSARRHSLDAQMRQASAVTPSGQPKDMHRRLDAANTLASTPFRFVDRLDCFRFLAVLPSEHQGYARLVIILCGWIEPVADLPLDASGRVLDDLLADLNRRIGEETGNLSEEGIQNIGLVCRYLFRPKKDKTAPQLLRCQTGIDRPTLTAALKRLARRPSPTHDPSRESPGITDAVLDGGA